jgi:hypothetical protein
MAIKIQSSELNGKEKQTNMPIKHTIMWIIAEMTLQFINVNAKTSSKFKHELQ